MPEALGRSIMLYLAVAAVFAAMAGLGTLPARLIERVQRPNRLLRLPLLAVAGWGLAALVSAAAAVADLDQTWPARALLGLGLVLLVPFRAADRTSRLQLASDLAVLLGLAAPLGLLVAATPATGFDEFAQWLPNTRYLVEHGRYWVWPDWIGASSKPGYPNGSVVVALLVSQWVGPEVEAPFKIFVVLLLGGFGAALASLAVASPTADPARAWKRRVAAVGAMAAGCLVSFLDPFVDPRISLTALADTPTAVILAMGGLVASLGVGAARRGADGGATSWFAWTGLLSLTLVMLRTTNIVLVAAIGLSCGILVLTAKAGGLRLRLRWAAILLGPTAAGEAVWHAYLLTARIGADMTPRPLSDWDWAAPLTVARVFLLDRLSGNLLIAAGALCIVGLALVGGIVVWRRLETEGDDDHPPPRPLLALTGIITLSFLAFLSWTYIAVFSPDEVARAASLWRYLTELGPLIVLAGCSILFSLVPARWWEGRSLRALTLAGGGACVLTLLLPLIARDYYRLDCRYPDVMAARRVADQLRSALRPFGPDAPGTAARAAVLHPTMGDWMAYALAFDLRWPASDRLVQFRTKDEPLADTEAWAWDRGLDALLDFTPLDRPSLLASRMVPSVSVLGRPAAKGDAWPVLATTTAQALPSCSLLSR
jgi:hypothetical protein